ncbi:MAG: ribosome biogenesis GTPase YlqF [Clostridiales bacterium]|nr:ribosome biogenesis GTPase YlqF [Clostridiales bacterium]
MIIQWFPGHMTKAFRLMEKEIKLVDAIIYVLDSRAPFSCVNPKFPSLIGDKPIIYVFSKVDMADRSKVDEWINGYFKKDNTRCIVLNSTASGSGKKVENAIIDVCKPKIDKMQAKGIKATLRAMVIGVPNCGKSTLINNLCGKAKTVTGNKPGVTKGKQWVRIASGIELLDMPGTLWPAFDNTQVAKNLAYIGSIREEVLDIPELALDFIGDMRQIDQVKLEQRYNITISEEDSNLEVIERICESRKYLLRGGDYDYDRCCSSIISDFKKGLLGCITLEKFADIKKLMKKDRKEKTDV